MKIEAKEKTEGRKYCDYGCPEAEPSDNIPQCYTISPIYCRKYNQIVQKNSLCLKVNMGGK